MKPASSNAFLASSASLRTTSAERSRPSVVRRFGNTVDVRNRGALKVVRLVGMQSPGNDAPAVVRMWSGENCRELSVNDARALAAQLVEAAAYAELQNGA